MLVIVQKEVYKEGNMVMKNGASAPFNTQIAPRTHSNPAPGIMSLSKLLAERTYL
jgi:hypothetical protein